MFDPKVELIDCFQKSGFDIAVATARTCYSSKPVRPEDVQKKPDLAQKIAEGTFEAGHHTTWQHAQFHFLLTGVSRQFVWSFPHAHMFYNSEQVSQRYVRVKDGSFVVPPLEGKALQLYLGMIEEQNKAYEELGVLVNRAITDEYYKIFPARKRDHERWKGAVEKRVLEAARYVLPIATTANLYHTVSGITLMRYHRMCGQLDVPVETRMVVGAMVDAARAKDPAYFKLMADPIPLEETPEFRQWSELYGAGKFNPRSGDFAKEFDASLDGRVSRLVDYKVNAEESVADSVREVFGVPKSAMSDDEAIGRAVNPKYNPFLGQTLNVSTHSKLTRVLHHPHYTFRKKLSHTADSQDQRHRMTPASRPILQGQFNPNEPDCVWPQSFYQSPAVLDRANALAKKTWETVNALMDEGVSFEFAQYLLPNSVAVRFTESGDLLNMNHKLHMRLCYLAQEEIWRASKDELEQMREVHPRLTKYLGPPCLARKLIRETPYCPEGDRFCGVPVWNLKVEDYKRVI